jgi:hypothetical protein
VRRIQLDFFYCNFDKVKHITMADAKKKKSPLSKVLADITTANKKRNATRKAAITKMRSDRAIARRKKRRASSGSVTGLQRLRGFGRKKK